VRLFIVRYGKHVFIKRASVEDAAVNFWRLCDGGSGVGTAMSSGAASLSTADAGVAGVSGGFTLGTGIAMDGDSGVVAISSGLSGPGTGGDISVTVGSGDTAGGSFSVTGSASSVADGESVELTAGSTLSGAGGMTVHRRVVELGSWWISTLESRERVNVVHLHLVFEYQLSIQQSIGGGA
jgi:hypothetical protein